MSTHHVKNIKAGAILLANDLRTGLTVYLQRDGQWSSSQGQAWIVTNDAEAEEAKALGAISADNNDVMEPYLVDTTTDGDPTHIREQLRTTGPSVAYIATRS